VVKLPCPFSSESITHSNTITEASGLGVSAVAAINNADRKIGHLLPVPDGHLYGCDHGVCFAEDYKLRTGAVAGARQDAAPALSRGARRLADNLAGGWLAKELPQGQDRQAPQAPRPPVPFGGLARRPLAPSLKTRAARPRQMSGPSSW